MRSNQDPLPTIDPQCCNGCALCVRVCPTGALGMVAGQAHLVDPSACIWCSRCEHLCPTDAIGLPYVIRFEEDGEGGQQIDGHG